MCDFANLTANGAGEVAMSGDLLRLYRALDQRFLALAAAFQPEEYRFPSMIDAAAIAKVDYLHSFPQHATFPVVLDPSADNLRRFQQGPVMDAEQAVVLRQLAPVRSLLTPAACYHFYIHFQQSAFAGPRYLTTKNTCFRNEHAFTPLERQWSFSMREIVCIGDYDDTQGFLATMRAAVSAWVAELGLAVQWEVASDPFFDPSNNPKHLLQRIQPNKWEMMFEDRLALGSANHHRTYFGEAFGIEARGATAHTACVAFGVERWMAALLATYGASAADWPAALLEAA